MSLAQQIAKTARIKISVRMTPIRAFLIGAAVGGLLAAPMLHEFPDTWLAVLASQALVCGGTSIGRRSE